MRDDVRKQYCYEDNPESRDVWVCQDWFPVGSYSKTLAGFPMNRLLKMQLDYMIQNVTDDWDFTLLICGEGEVRIGKCLKKGSKVLMSNGDWKNVEDVKIGDNVISPQKDGTTTIEKVTELHNRFENECYDVIEEGTNKVLYSCANNHEIPIYRYNRKSKKYEYEIIEARDLSKLSPKVKNETYCLSAPAIEFNNIEPKIKEYVPVYIKCIKSSSSQVYGFSITGESKLHITDNWMITHNSTIAQQIATYWTWSIMHLEKIKLPHSVKENMAFNGVDLIKGGNKLGRNHPYSALIFDEAGADLEGIKAMKQTTQAVKDYLRECGQYNMLNILVLPEFFDLPKSIAMNRSIAMLNVYWCADSDGSFRRGYFKFFNKPDKKHLYLIGKRDLNYNAWGETFLGQFPKFYTFDETEYKKAKKEALKNREQTGTREQKRNEVLYAYMKLMRDKLGLSIDEMTRQINKFMINFKITSKYIPRFIEAQTKNNIQDRDDWELPPEEGDAEGEIE